MAVAVLVAAAPATRIRAEEKPAAGGAQSEDGIAVAKREFDAVKAARDPASLQKGTLPRLTMPEIQTAPSAPAWSPLKPATPEKKPGNWLVDAMEKKGDARGKSGRGVSADMRGSAGMRGTDDTSAAEREGREFDADAKDATDRSETPSAAGNGKEKSPVVNPLTRYLGDWMTPRDFALLKPGLEQSLAGANAGGTNAFVPGAAGEPAIALPGADALSGVSAGLGGSQPTSIVPAVPRENPYLQMLNGAPTAGGPATNVAAMPASNVAISRPPPAIAAPPPPVAEPPKPRIPEFAKPATDEKYFKPLKRF